MAFFELRQYEIRPGKMGEWLEYMQNVIIPFQVKQGMVICGSFRGETDDSVYVWIRRFESEEDRERLYAAVYQGKPKVVERKTLTQTIFTIGQPFQVKS